jgi:hypothetical protein
MRGQAIFLARCAVACWRSSGAFSRGASTTPAIGGSGPELAPAPHTDVPWFLLLQVLVVLDSSGLSQTPKVIPIVSLVFAWRPRA